MSDVDLANTVLTVRNTKFYKSRLVPVTSQLGNAVRAYAERRTKAKSGFQHFTPQSAVTAAIRVADEILRAAANPPVRHAATPLAA